MTVTLTYKEVAKGEKRTGSGWLVVFMQRPAHSPVEKSLLLDVFPIFLADWGTIASVLCPCVASRSNNRGIRMNVHQGLRVMTEGSIDRPLPSAFSSQSKEHQLNPGRNYSLSTVDVERMISERGREKKEGPSQIIRIVVGIIKTRVK